MEEITENPDGMKHETVKRPMNAFLIFCKRHRGLVHQKNPSLDNRSVTRILGDLWANLGTDEKYVYTDLAKQYKEAFLKANPDYKWYNPEKHAAAQVVTTSNKLGRPSGTLSTSQSVTQTSEGISPGKLADPSNMGGLSMLLMAGQQTFGGSGHVTSCDTRTVSLPQTATAAVVSMTKVEPRDVNNTAAGRDFQHWLPTEASVVCAEGMTSASTTMRNFGKLHSEESFSIWKGNTEWPIDLSHSTDAIQNCSAKSQPATISARIKEEVSETQSMASSGYKINLPLSKSDQAKHSEDVTKVAWSTIQYPTVNRNSYAMNKTSRRGRAATPPPPKSDGVHSSVICSGLDVVSTSASSVVGKDQTTIQFLTNPLAYLFSQPAHQMLSWPRQAVITSTGMQTELPRHDHLGAVIATKYSEQLPTSVHKLLPATITKLSGIANNDLVFDDSTAPLANLNRNDLQQLVSERVIDTKEQKPAHGVQSPFPKTKKQLAVDKLSSTGKHSASSMRNGNHDARTSPTDTSSIPYIATSISDNGISIDTGGKVRGAKMLTAEEWKMVPNEILKRNGEAVETAGMTIAQINETLITKVVQEDHLPAIDTSLNAESRLPLKLQKKFKKLDGTEQSRSFSSLGLSNPEKTRSLFKASNGQLLSPANIFSSLVEKSNFTTAGEAKVQNASIPMNANLFSTNADVRCSSAFAADNRNFSSANSTSSAGNGLSASSSFSLPGTSQLAVNKLIETIIAQSFSAKDDSLKDVNMGLVPSSRNISLSHVAGNRAAYECESGTNGCQPLKHMNQMMDAINTQKRKRNKKYDSSEYPYDGGTVLQTFQKSDIKDSIVSITRNDPADGLLPPKRLKESTVSTPAEEFTSETSSVSLDICTKPNETTSLKFPGAWHLIDNLLNEGMLEVNGGRTQEEINNNSREKAARNVGYDTLPQMNKALRKSKRANQGLRYKELMSKGVLYTSRKSTDCNNLNEDNRDDAVAINDDEVNGIVVNGVAEAIVPRRHFHGDSTSADTETDVGRRYKSGDFDLEAHIACLPACQIEVADRKSAGKIKSRSHSQSQSSSLVLSPLVRIQANHRNDLNPDEIKNEAMLERISLSKLRSLNRLSTVSKNRCLLGSCRRKERKYGFFQILPMTLYNGEMLQIKDGKVLSEFMTFAGASPGDLQQAASVSHEADKTTELSKESTDAQNSFHILADAAVSSGD